LYETILKHFADKIGSYT